MTTFDRPTSAPKTLTVLGLMAAAAGILTQYFSGVEGFPRIPPGPIILLVAAAIVAFRSRPWAIAIGVFAALFVLIGGMIATVVNWGGRAPLSHPEEVAAFTGAVVQFLGVLTALVAGTVALRGNRRRFAA